MTGNTLIGKARRVTLGSDIGKRTGGDPGGAMVAPVGNRRNENHKSWRRELISQGSGGAPPDQATWHALNYINYISGT